MGFLASTGRQKKFPRRKGKESSRDRGQLHEPGAQAEPGSSLKLGTSYSVSLNPALQAHWENEVMGRVPTPRGCWEDHVRRRSQGFSQGLAWREHKLEGGSVTWGPGGPAGCLGSQEIHLADLTGGPALAHVSPQSPPGQPGCSRQSPSLRPLGRCEPQRPDPSCLPGSLW